jgi:hypothetical protein
VTNEMVTQVTQNRVAPICVTILQSLNPFGSH